MRSPLAFGAYLLERVLSAIEEPRGKNITQLEVLVNLVEMRLQARQYRARELVDQHRAPRI